MWPYTYIYIYLYTCLTLYDSIWFSLPDVVEDACGGSSPLPNTLWQAYAHTHNTLVSESRRKENNWQCIRSTSGCYVGNKLKYSKPGSKLTNGGEELAPGPIWDEVLIHNNKLAKDQICNPSGYSRYLIQGLVSCLFETPVFHLLRGLWASKVPESNPNDQQSHPQDGLKTPCGTCRKQSIWFMRRTGHVLGSTCEIIFCGHGAKVSLKACQGALGMII